MRGLVAITGDLQPSTDSCALLRGVVRGCGQLCVGAVTCNHQRAVVRCCKMLCAGVGTCNQERDLQPSTGSCAGVRAAMRRCGGLQPFEGTCIHQRSICEDLQPSAGHQRRPAAISGQLCVSAGICAMVRGATTRGVVRMCKDLRPSAGTCNHERANVRWCKDCAQVQGIAAING